MVNKNLFSSKTINKTPVANSVNEAGGAAYSVSSEEALAQYVVTGTLNGTFYANADEQLDTILVLAASCSSEFLARAAVYARRHGKMKDTPVLLAAILSTRNEEGLNYLNQIFYTVINNQKQLRSFVQIIRSGKIGRKSFGTAVKRFINDWFRSQSGDQLFYQSIGQDPSLKDVIKLTHPKPANTQQNALFGWLLDKEYNKRSLPPLVKAFEAYKADPAGNAVPAVDFRMLSALNLDTNAWSAIAHNAGWNMIRMNLNTFARHGCFDDRKFVAEIAAKLSDAEEVRRSNAFPYKLLTTYQNIESDVPVSIKNALQNAMEIATENTPVFDGITAVCVDTSGSMRSAVTGDRGSATTNTKCVDVAALVAACILRKNSETVIVPFDTGVREVDLNPLDSIITNASKLALDGGGTDCASPLRHLRDNNIKVVDTVIFLSDNQKLGTTNVIRVEGLLVWLILGRAIRTMLTARQNLFV